MSQQPGWFVRKRTVVYIKKIAREAKMSPCLVTYLFYVELPLNRVESRSRAAGELYGWSQIAINPTAKSLRVGARILVRTLAWMVEANLLEYKRFHRIGFYRWAKNSTDTEGTDKISVAVETKSDETIAERRKREHIQRIARSLELV